MQSLPWLHTIARGLEGPVHVELNNTNNRVPQYILWGMLQEYGVDSSLSHIRLVVKSLFHIGSSKSD